jgi:hypothetical protein
VMQGTYQRGNAASLVAVDGNTYDVKSATVQSLGQSSTWEATVPTNLTPLSVDYLALKWTLAGPTAATQFVFAYNWSKGQYESLATRPVRSGVAETYEIPVDMGRFIRSDGMMKIAVRGLLPVRNGVMPSAFSLRVDMIKVLGLRKQVN